MTSEDTERAIEEGRRRRSRRANLTTAPDPDENEAETATTEPTEDATPELTPAPAPEAKKRGRPKGSTNKKPAAAKTAGTGARGGSTGTRGRPRKVVPLHESDPASVHNIVTAAVAHFVTAEGDPETVTVGELLVELEKAIVAKSLAAATTA